MNAYCVLAEIENNRMEDRLEEEHYEASILNPTLFNDLSTVFENSNGYKKLYIKIFEDIDKFELTKISSVTDNQSSLAFYKDIELYDHLFRTYEKMYELVIHNRTYDIQRDLHLLIALLHDIGKAHNLCEFYSIDLKHPHDVRSAKYFEVLVLQDLENNFNLDSTSYNIILNTLRNHHQPIKGEKTIWHKLLEKADGLAREEETKILEKRV